jgi:hypothetical protein
MIRAIGICLAALVVSTAAGGATNSAKQLPLRRGCPPANFRPPRPPGFSEAVAIAKRVVYGQRYTEQGQTIVTTPRNTRLVAAMEIDRGVTLIPGMPRWYALMQRRCGKRTPLHAWAFEFAIPTNAPDFSPAFVVKTARAWYVF